MRKDLSQKILAIREAALDDEIYRELMQEHTVRNAQFLATMETLSCEQQEVVYDYLGVLVQMHYRMLELECE